MIVTLKKYGKSLNIRHYARKIFSDLPEFSEKEIILDFSGVESATPSFCHEMMSVLISEKGKKIVFKNINDSVKFQIEKAFFVFKSEKNKREFA